ncbi:MAG TPA: hypothetical protein VHZ07_08545 [Bryobacteraceae bacterium]|nr:hypothetical protein [Bryobacteraceae bacterium]
MARQRRQDGQLNDYSVIANGDGYLEHGMRPCRDFFTPQQTLTYLLSYGSEILFGHRYLSLAYANLILTGALFVAVVLLARRAVGYLRAVFIGFSLCCACTLIHGILWYNPLGIFLLTLVSLICTGVLERLQWRPRDVLLYLLVLVATGMTKLNYHAAAVAFAIFTLVFLYFQKRLTAKKAIGLGVFLSLWAAIVPATVEMIVTGVTPAQWIFNVLILASSRIRHFALFFKPVFWIGPVYPTAYTGNPFWCVFGGALVGYVWLARKLRRESATPTTALPRWAPTSFAELLLMAFLLNLGGCLHFQRRYPSVGESILVLGLLSVCIGLNHLIPTSHDIRPAADGPVSPRSVESSALVQWHCKAARAPLHTVFQASGMALSLWLTIASMVGILDHTRLAIGFVPPLRSFPHRVTSGSYLDGVFLSDLSYSQLESAKQWLERLHIGANSNRVYWGAGIEMLSREFKTQPLRKIPVGFNSTTIRAVTDDAIIKSLHDPKRSIFLADPLRFGMYASPNATPLSGSQLAVGAKTTLARVYSLKAGWLTQLIFRFAEPVGAF